MKRCYRICFLFIFLLFCKKSTAQTGCLLDGTNYVYTNHTCTIGLFGACLIKYYPPSANPNPFTTNTQCFSYTTTSVRCGTGLLNGLLLANGIEVHYSYAFPCPIDDYAWLLVVSSASMLFFKIRNRKD